MSPQKQAESYFANMRARDIDALVALFADDCVMILPDGRELVGQGAIRGMYVHLFGMTAPSPAPQRFVVDGRTAATEIEARFEDGTARRTANFFDYNDAGRIVRLSIYKRG